MLQDDIPCVLVACAGLLGRVPCILLGSSSPQQPGPTAELSLPKLHLQLLPHTRFALLWWCLRFPLHGSLNLALSSGTFWPTRLHTNLEAVKICADLQVLHVTLGNFALYLPNKLHCYSWRGKKNPAKFPADDRGHARDHSHLLFQLQLHKKYEKILLKMLIVTKVNLDWNKNV